MSFIIISSHFSTLSAVFGTVCAVCVSFARHRLAVPILSIAAARCFKCCSCVWLCTSTSSMYVSTFSASASNTSISLEKLAGAPISPCGHVLQWYCPFPRMVKAVNGRSDGRSCHCQNRLLQSSAEYTLLPALPTVSKHSSIVLRAYRSLKDELLTLL
jgi:hypothetical protein